MLVRRVFPEWKRFKQSYWKQELAYTNGREVLLSWKHWTLRKLRPLLILAPWIWGGHFCAMDLVPDRFTLILWICMHVENWMVIMILYLEFAKRVISTMFHFWNMFLTKITPAMYGKTYCAFRQMAWATALGNWLLVMNRMIVYYYACCWKHFNGLMYIFYYFTYLPMYSSFWRQ